MPIPKSIWHEGEQDFPVKSSVPTLAGSPDSDNDTLLGELLRRVRITVPAGVKALPASMEPPLGETEIEKSKLCCGGSGGLFTVKV